MFNRTQRHYGSVRYRSDSSEFEWYEDDSYGDSIPLNDWKRNVNERNSYGKSNRSNTHKTTYSSSEYDWFDDECQPNVSTQNLSCSSNSYDWYADENESSFESNLSNTNTHTSSPSQCNWIDMAAFAPIQSSSPNRTFSNVRHIPNRQPKFSGLKVDNCQLINHDVEFFLRYLHYQMCDLKISPQQMLTKIPNYLYGPALNWYTSSKHVLRSWDAFIFEFRNRFSPTIPIDIVTTSNVPEIDNRTQSHISLPPMHTNVASAQHQSTQIHNNDFIPQNVRNNSNTSNQANQMQSNSTVSNSRAQNSEILPDKQPSLSISIMETLSPPSEDDRVVYPKVNPSRFKFQRSCKDFPKLINKIWSKSKPISNCMYQVPFVRTVRQPYDENCASGAGVQIPCWNFKKRKKERWKRSVLC